MGKTSILWKDYFRRRQLFQMALIVYVPLLILAMNFFKDYIVAIFIVYGILVVLPLGIRHVLCPCPNCGKSIHFKTVVNFLGRTCSNCGILIGQSF